MAIELINAAELKDIDETEYRAAVEEGRAICAAQSAGQWALGDLAALVTKRYGENRIERFAIDINFHGAPCTLGRYRSVCYAFPKTGPRPCFFASGKALQTHPDRIQMVTENPNISGDKAREKMRRWRAEQADEDQADEDQADEDQADEDQADEDGLYDDEEDDDEDIAPVSGATTSTQAKTGKKTKKAKNAKTAALADFSESKLWLAKQVEHADTFIRAFGEVAEVRDERDNFTKVVAASPTSSGILRQPGRLLLEWADWLDELAADAEEPAIRKAA
jgi:hypothetical protein